MVSNSVSNKAQDNFFALKCFMPGAPHLVWVFLIPHEAKGMCSFECASISDVMLLHLLHSLSTLILGWTSVSTGVSGYLPLESYALVKPAEPVRLVVLGLVFEKGLGHP